MNIDKLKNKILQLAIQGKLVAQDENDESAEVLYEKIQEEKEQLIKEKKIRKVKVDSIEEDDIPFEIPESWKWVRLGDIVNIVGGGTPKTKVKEYWESGTINWLTPADLSGYNNKYITNGRRNITELGLKESSAQLMPEGTVLFSSRAPIGYVAIAEESISTNQGFKSCVLYYDLYSEYIYYYLKIKGKEINESSSGTTFKEVSGREMNMVIFSLPPLNEQKRIVKKIDELFKIIDELNNEKEDILKLIERTRESVLTKAIQGKLVEQDENDESAEVVYGKIQEEKDQLIKEKKIRRVKVDEIEQDDISFEIPGSWKWVRLGDITNIVGGGTPKTKVDKYWENGTINWLTPADLSGYNDKYILNGRRNITVLGLKESSAQLMPKGTVLFSSRAPIGYVAISEDFISTNQGFKSCVPYNNLYNEYIYYYLKIKGKEINDASSGTTFKEVSGREMNNVMFTLPPLNEQKRIVEKIDKVMNYLDEIESSIRR